jgi:hypothetical protein
VLIDFTLARHDAGWRVRRLQIPMVVGATGTAISNWRKSPGAIPIVKATNFNSGIRAIVDWQACAGQVAV